MNDNQNFNAADGIGMPGLENVPPRPPTETNNHSNDALATVQRQESTKKRWKQQLRSTIEFATIISL